MTITANPTLAPATWDDYIGQPDLKERLDLALDASVAGDRPLEHILLIGPAGTGKSTVARILASELKEVELIEYTRPLTLKKVTEVFLLNGDVGHDVIVFFDEVHAYPRDAQEALLPVIAERTFDSGWGPEPCSNITVVAATTDGDKVIEPLRQRFRIAPEFAPYTDEDMAAIAAGMARRAGLDLDDGMAEAISAAAGGVPRQANALVTTAAELNEAGRPVTIDAVLRLCQVEPDGLTARHVEYLRVLYSNRGLAGQAQLANRLRINNDEVRNIERVLADRNLIAFTSNGRQLTGLGRNRIR